MQETDTQQQKSLHPNKYISICPPPTLQNKTRSIQRENYPLPED